MNEKNQTTVKKDKTIILNLNDKHEPFGSISIERIKQVLAEEDFTELQSLFFYMMRDLKIAGAVMARREPLLALDYSLDTENQAYKEWLEGDDVDLGELITQLSFAIYYGVSLSDVSYQVKEGLLAPTFNLVSPRFLHAHKDKTLKKTIDHLYIKQGETKRFINKFDPAKLIFHKHAVDIGEITDFSLASKLVWYFSLKHIALAHNLQYFDAVATPPLIAKSDGDEEELIENLFQLKSASVGSFGKEDIIEYLNVSNKADFLKFIEYIDSQIATLILGNTLSTGDGKTGSYSQSKTHEKRQTEKLGFDAKKIAKSLTAYLNHLEKLNFANAKGIKFSFDLKEDDDLEKLSQVVKNLSDAGFELDHEDVSEKTGFKIIGKSSNQRVLDEKSAPEPNNKADASKENNRIQPSHGNGCACCGGKENNKTQSDSKPKKELPVDLSSPMSSMVLDELDSVKIDTAELEEELLNQVTQLLEQADNYDDAFNALLDAYPTFDIDALEAAMFKAVANSALLADAEIQE